MTAPDPQSPNEDAGGDGRWPTEVGTIRRGMPVVGTDGETIGTVARVADGEIELDGGGLVPLTLVDGASEDAVLLQPRGDATFGLGAQP